MKNSKISVIIPAYNVASYLEKTISSVLAQTHKNLEIIAIDDGSTDGTAAIIDAYAARDHRIKAIHKVNGGVTSARLRGVAEATGEWIGFVDGDDTIEPDMYEHLLKNALEHDADISHCGYQMVFPSRTDLYHDSNKLIIQDNTLGLNMLIEGGLVEPGLCNKLFRNKLFIGLSDWMDTSIKINEDLLMNFYLFRVAKKSVFHDVCKYHYIVRSDSAANSTLNEHKLLDPLRVTDILLNETAGDSSLHTSLYVRLANILIPLATRTLSENSTLIRPHRETARNRLRALVPTYAKGSYPFSIKLKVFWAAVWPWSYGFVHRLYLRITGLDKIYDIS